MFVQSDTISGTHQMLRCKRCGGEALAQCTRASKRDAARKAADLAKALEKKKGRKTKQKKKPPKKKARSEKVKYKTFFHANQSILVLELSLTSSAIYAEAAKQKGPLKLGRAG